VSLRSLAIAPGHAKSNGPVDASAGANFIRQIATGGNREATARALSLASSIPPNAQVLDIACGPIGGRPHAASPIASERPGRYEITGISAGPLRPHLLRRTRLQVLGDFVLPEAASTG
jgi:hypothetical protein